MKVDIGFFDINGNYIPDIQEVSEVEMDKEIMETKNFNEFFDELNEMANFKNFGESKEEEITNADGSRNWEANILLDNVKRLEQENAKQKEMIKKQWKLLEQCGVSAGGELKRVSYLLEQLMEQNKELIEDNLNLSKENARLKEENQSLSMLGTDLANAHETVRKEFFRADKNKDMWREKTEKLQQTLQEIKDYLNTLSGIDNDFVNTETYLRILDCITKAESEG